MLNTIDTGEEPASIEELTHQVSKLDEMIQVAENLHSVEDGVKWMKELKNSLSRIHNLKSRLWAHINGAANGEQQTATKDRLLVRKGVEFQSLHTSDVAFIFTENKLVFVVDKDGKKFLAHANNLCDLMMQLNTRLFYRANRKYIININFIKKYRTLERVKVEVELALQNPEFVVISQENSGSFKHWIENL